MCSNLDGNNMEFSMGSYKNDSCRLEKHVFFYSIFRHQMKELWRKNQSITAWLHFCNKPFLWGLSTIYNHDFSNKSINCIMLKMFSFYPSLSFLLAFFLTENIKFVQNSPMLKLSKHLFCLYCYFKDYIPWFILHLLEQQWVILCTTCICK